METIRRATMREDALAGLAADESFIGWVYSMDYDTALVMTNDAWKRNVGGIPQNCFLIAAPFQQSSYGDAPADDRAAVLLRVVGTASLPLDEDMLRTRIDHLQRQRGRLVDRLDPVTTKQLQMGGLECHVLGTFYRDEEGQLRLGSDIETFSVADTFMVFRPKQDALSTIVNFVDPDLARQAAALISRLRGTNAPFPVTNDQDVMAFRLGTIRYTSTARLHRAHEADLVEVRLPAADFLARRTAIFGMTRTGKSNSMKHIVSAVKTVADRQRVPIGQLLFDIRGEYASANTQDLTSTGEASSLADAFPSEVVSYRAVATEGFRHVLNNFYAEVEEGLAVMQDLLRGAGRQLSTDVEAFLTLSMDRPDDDADMRTKKKYALKKAAYFTLLYRAGFAPPAGFVVRFDSNEQVREAMAPYWSQRREDAPPNPSDGLSPADAADWLECARLADIDMHQSLLIAALNSVGVNLSATPTRSKLNDAAQQAGIEIQGPGLLRSSGSGSRWLSDDTRAILNLAARRNDTNTPIRGWRAIEDFRMYHSPLRSGVAEQEIYGYLREGKIVIIDLSVGSPLIRASVTQRVARYVFSRSQEIFLRGQTPPTIMVYIEEAHNYIEQNAKLTDTWPLLAKEGAKFRIGLVYSTQEPSSIHPNILSNTENWIVTHLNNDDELRALGKFYDFKDFARSLKSATDIGFARVRTLSGRFVVPIQVDKFDPAAVRSVRSASG